jgi:hypothetical protein
MMSTMPTERVELRRTNKTLSPCSHLDVGGELETDRLPMRNAIGIWILLSVAAWGIVLACVEAAID